MLSVIAYVVSLLIAAGVGWWAKGKYGAKAQAEVTVAESLAKKL